MTATLIPAATETEWLEARRHGVTASEIAVVMGLSPYDSPFALYHRKRGELPGIEDTDAMERGRVLEPYIAEKFAMLHPEFNVIGDGRMLYAHPGRPWQMATPDRLIDGCDCDPLWRSEAHRCPLEPLAVLECKTDAGGDDGWGEEGTDQIPVHYRCQVLWQMDVLGVTTAYVALLAMRSWKLRVYELTLDGQAEDDLGLMRSHARVFLSRLDRGDPPEVDWRPQTTAALKHLHPSVEQVDVTIGRRLAISYRAAVRRAAEADRRKELMTNRMLQTIGDGRRAIDPDGRTVATRSVYPQRRIATSALRKDYPDAAAACTVTSDVIKLLPAKPEKDTA